MHRTPVEGTMNEAKLHEFMGKVVTDMGGAWMMAMVLIGDELGLYKAMANGKEMTAEALAERFGCHPRLVREWLDANVASGISRVPPAPTGFRRSKRWRSRMKTLRCS